MRISIYFILLPLLAVIGLTACFTPHPVIQMEAEQAEATKWNYGRQVFQMVSDSVSAAIFFDNHNKKYLVFDVEVTNWGNKEVLVSPEEIYLHQAETDGRIYAFDPEQEIFGKKMKASKDEAAAKNLAVAVGVATVATVVAVAATSDGGNNNNDGGNFNSFTYISTDVVPPVPLNYYPPAIEFWENVSLRKTTLAKGYKAGGKIVFPRMDNLRSFAISIPVDGKLLTAHFKQRVYQP